MNNKKGLGELHKKFSSKTPKETGLAEKVVLVKDNNDAQEEKAEVRSIAKSNKKVVALDKKILASKRYTASDIKSVLASERISISVADSDKKSMVSDRKSTISDRKSVASGV